MHSGETITVSVLCVVDFRLLKQCRQYFELKCELMGSLTGWQFCCFMTFVDCTISAA